VIATVAKGDLADSAGWRPGDLITAVDGVAIGTMTELGLAVDRGDRTKVFTLRRGERTFESTVEFQDPSDQ
jgi:S1-C subfamily serine protease